MRKLALPRADVLAHHWVGESIRELARRYGVGTTAIRKYLYEWGVKPRPTGSRRKRGGPLYSDRRGYLHTYGRGHEHCWIHRARWEAKHGTIPKNYDVHHIDGDVGNNSIDNLACMLHGEHIRLHRLAEGKR